MQLLKTLMLILATVSCKSRDSELKSPDVKITYPDGTTESPEKDGLRLEIYSGSRNLSGKTFYFVSPLNNFGHFFYSEDQGKTLKKIKPFITYKGKPFDGEVPIWLEQAKSTSSGAFIEDKFSILSFAPSSLQSNGSPLIKSIRGHNNLATETSKKPFMIGFNDDTFDFGVDLSLNPPTISFDFKEKDYGMSSLSKGKYTTSNGFTFFCSEANTAEDWKSTLMFLGIYGTPFALNKPDLQTTSWVTDINGVSLQDSSCQEAAQIVDEAFFKSSIKLRVQSLKKSTNYYATPELAIQYLLAEPLKARNTAEVSFDKISAPK